MRSFKFKKLMDSNWFIITVFTVMAVLLLLLCVLMARCDADGKSGFCFFSDSGSCNACGGDGKGGGKDMFTNEMDVSITDKGLDTKNETSKCPGTLPDVCKPKKALEAFCHSEQKLCYLGYEQGKKCQTDADCQDVPSEECPPFVCWGVPCELEGKWDCDYTSLTITMEENGDFCVIHSDFGPPFYFQPGWKAAERSTEAPKTLSVKEGHLVFDNMGMSNCIPEK